MKHILAQAVVVVSLVSFMASSSTTLIRSTDPEAKIYLDGELRGKGSPQPLPEADISPHTVRSKGIFSDFYLLSA